MLRTVELTMSNWALAKFLVVNIFARTISTQNRYRLGYSAVDTASVIVMRQVRDLIDILA